jgi:putative addiction module antidote
VKKGKLRKVGNSLGLTLPAELMRQLDLREGDEVSLRISGETLMVERLNPELLEQMEAYRLELAKFKHTFKALD